MKIGIIQADQRQHEVYNAFMNLGHEVIWVNEYNIFHYFDAIILPMPVSQNDETVFMQNWKLEKMFAALRGKRVYGGRCSSAVRQLAKQHQVELMDYFESEQMIILNIVPTVEGAIQIAMEQTNYTLHGSHILICGFGRIGKLLAHDLKALGASITVTARKEKDLAWCEVLGYRPVQHEYLYEAVKKQNIIFNTVPSVILNTEILSNMDKNTKIIDLASLPGGVEIPAAKKLGLTVVSALSLPGKIAPKTAGEIICKTILNLYKEENTYGG